MATKLQTELQPASFRQTPFLVEPQSGIGMEGGRRVIIHEYPQRDIPYAQDLGRAAREVEFMAFVVGADYIAQSKALLGALEAFGPGKLVHPWLGELTVNIQSYHIRYTHELGRAELQISAVESGELKFPESAASTSSATRTAASNLLTESVNWFGKTASFLGFINRVAVGALAVYGRVLRFLGNPAGVLLGLFGMGTNGLLGNISSLFGLFGVPVKLGWSFAGLVSLSTQAGNGSLVAHVPNPAKGIAGTATGITGTASKTATATGNASTPDTAATSSDPRIASQYDAIYIALIKAHVAMISNPILAAPPQQTDAFMTATSRQMIANETAIVGHARLVLLSNAIGLSSLVAGILYDDAVAARIEILKTIDAEMLIAANDAIYTALRDARVAVAADLSAKIRDSARLIAYRNPATRPGLAVAYDVHGDATREPELIARNKIRHPGFVGIGELRVLSR